MRADSERVLRVVVEIYRLVSLMGWDGMGREDEIPAKQQRSADPCSRHGHAGTSRKKVASNKGTITARAHRHRAGISLEEEKRAHTLSSASQHTQHITEQLPSSLQANW